jgi:hypothetical protein
VLSKHEFDGGLTQLTAHNVLHRNIESPSDHCCKMQMGASGMSLVWQA